MDLNKPYGLIPTIRSFLIEKKNKKLFLLSLTAIFILVVFGILLTAFLVKSSKQAKKKSADQIITVNTPKPITPAANDEQIQKAGFSIDCQLIITTSSRKLYIKKLDQCNNVLDYKISPSKKYIGYVLYNNKKIGQLFIYSLENNVEALFQIISQSIIDYQFDLKDNLLMILDRKNQTSPQIATYYFNTLLFSEYPTNYYKDPETFTNLDKRKVDTVLPPAQQDEYSKIIIQQNELDLVNAQGKVLYIIKESDLEAQLTPTPPPSVNKETLQWDKRIFLFRNGQFITMDQDGSNEIVHQFMCDGIEVVPIGYERDFFSRSPDGKTLAFLAPTEDQMRNDPSWKTDLLAKKKIFDQGEIVLYDFVKNACQRTAIVQTIHFGETFAFSPNGLYLAFINKGVSLYNLQASQDYQLAIHNPDNDSDATAVTGPVIWDGESKFIFVAVSKMQGQTPITTTINRIYFNDRLEGTEQVILNLPSANTLYTVSPDGNKILYKQGQTIYKYVIDTKNSSLLKTGTTVNSVNKLIWLRNNTIISNVWVGNEALQFDILPASSIFQADYGGELLVYNPIKPNQAVQIVLYDLNLRKEKLFKDKKIIEGELLHLYY